jgi:hypothetical protein
MALSSGVAARRAYAATARRLQETEDLQAARMVVGSGRPRRSDRISPLG